MLFFVHARVWTVMKAKSYFIQFSSSLCHLVVSQHQSPSPKDGLSFKTRKKLIFHFLVGWQFFQRDRFHGCKLDDLSSAPFPHWKQVLYVQMSNYYCIFGPTHHNEKWTNYFIIIRYIDNLVFSYYLPTNKQRSWLL